MSPSKIHLFIAVPIPDSIKQQISDWCQQIQKQLSFKKWIFPADYHITLKFLGGVDDNTAVKLKPLIEKIVSEQSAFSLTAEGLGTFGKSGSPRILWAGIKGEIRPLYILQKSIDSSMELLGFIPENRPYSPHLTIAKNYTLKTMFETKYLEQAASHQPAPLDWQVHDIVLYQTHLGREPMYEPLETFSFGKAVIPIRIASPSLTS
jgi:2'-5' RNA ligase